MVNHLAESPIYVELCGQIDDLNRLMSEDILSLNKKNA
jgi:hypothetical protein